MRKYVLISLLITCFLPGAVIAEGLQVELSKKEKIVVFPFAEARQFGFKTGQAVADTIITELINMKRFEVADRVNIERIMKEQALALSGLMDESNAVKVGELLGAKTSIMGSITGFSIGKNKKKGFDGSLSVDIKVVNIETSGIEKATNLSVSASVGFSATVSDNTQRERIRKKLFKKVSGKFFNTMRDYFKLKTYIMTVDGSKISLRMGKDMGIRKNFRFDAVAKGAEIKDPITGELLEVKENKIAHIWVTKVDNKISYGRVTSKKGVVTPGMQLIETPTRNIAASITGGVYPFKQSVVTSVTYNDDTGNHVIDFNFNSKITQAVVLGFESGKQFYSGSASLGLDVLIASPIIGIKCTGGGLINFLRAGPLSLGVGANVGFFLAGASLGSVSDTAPGGFSGVPSDADLTAMCIGVGGEGIARLSVNISKSFAFNINCGYAYFLDAPWLVSASWSVDDESYSKSLTSGITNATKPSPLQLQGLIIRGGISWSF